MTGITWLHLSDWHQRGKDFDRHVVGDKLLEDILNRGKNIHPDLEKVDLVIFSGDVAFSAKAEEYRSARETLFEPVLEVTGLSKDRLFIIPGNHDFDRDEIEYLPEDIKRPFESDERFNKWLAEDKGRSHLLSPFTAYQHFVNEYTGQHQPAYASIQRVKGLSKSIALIGLNSALMCNRHKNEKNEVDDRGFLVVGEPQIHDPLKQIADAEVRIAVVHHPFDWLTEFDRDHVEDQLKRACHFILCGHLHRPKVTAEQGTAGECVVIPAGALYDKRIPHNPRYTNAYNLVHLDFDTAQGTIYFRRWSEGRNEWIEDIESHPKGGQFPFRLPKVLGHPPPSPASTTLMTSAQAPLASSLSTEREKRIIEGYLKALISRNADLEPGGIRQTGVQVVLPLDEIYIGLQADRDRPDVDRRVMQEDLDEIKKSLDAEEDPEKRERQYQVWAQQARILQRALELDGPREELSSIVQRHRQLVILGEPGSGKTTLLRYLALRFAQAIVDEPDRIFQAQDLWDDNNVWQLPDLGTVRLPILIRISHYAEARQKDPDLALLDYFSRYFAGLQVPDADKLGILLRRLLDEGRCLVLLDGLDEIVDPTDRLEIAAAIGQFTDVFREVGLPEWLSRSLVSPLSKTGVGIERRNNVDKDAEEVIIQWDKRVPEDVRQEWEKQFKKRRHGVRAQQIAWELLRGAPYAHVGNRFVVTSRIAGYHFAGVPGDFEHYTIRRMGLEDIKLFLEKWCPAVERRIAKEPDSAQVKQRAQKEIEGILRSIETTSGIRRMAENPLLLRILALIHHTYSHLPQRRVELYETATITLLRDWNLQRGLGEEVIIDEPVAMSLLGPVALWIHEHRPSGLLTKGEVEAQLRRILASEQGETLENPSLAVRTAVDKFLNTVRQYSGLFVERGEGLFGFMHLTFEEYFTARQLTSNLERAREEIMSRLHQPRWREPILLAVGALSKQFYDSTDALLQAILDHGTNDPYEKTLHRNLLFAAACVSDSVSVFPRRRQQIAERLLSLYCEDRHASRFRLLQKQIKDALFSLRNDRGDVSVEAALAMILSRSTNFSNLTRALEMVAWLKAHTKPVYQALEACPYTGMLPLVHQLRREVQSRLDPNGNGTAPIPTGWGTYGDDPVLSRLLGAMWRYGWKDAIETGLRVPSQVISESYISQTLIHLELDLQEELVQQDDSLKLFPYLNLQRETLMRKLRLLTRETGNATSSITSQELEQLIASLDYTNFTPTNLRSALLQVQQLREKVENREELPESLVRWGSVIVRNAQSGNTLVPFFTDRAGHLIPLQLETTVVALCASVDAIQVDLARDLEDTLHTTQDPERYYEAAIFLVCIDEGEFRNGAVSIVLADLKGAGSKRRHWALQVLSNSVFHQYVEFTDVQYALLIGLLDGPVDQAFLALSILFDIGLTPSLLASCWAVLRNPDHHISGAIREKLGWLEEVEGTEHMLNVLDKGLRDPALRTISLELLLKISWQGIATFKQALIWLLSEDTAVRARAALLLADQQDPSRDLYAVILEANQERLERVQPSSEASWALLQSDMQVMRLLNGLWLNNWGDELTYLWFGQSAETYEAANRSRKYWRNFQTYLESEEVVRQLLEKAEFNQALIPLFQEAAQQLVELEHGVIEGAPKEEHIATVRETLSSRLAESPYTACVLPRITLHSILTNADHPLSCWVSSQLAHHGLNITAAPVTLLPLLNDNNIGIRVAAALTLLSVDISALVLPILVESAQSSDDNVRTKGLQGLYDFCSQMPSDGSSDSLDWLIRWGLTLQQQQQVGYISTIAFRALFNVNFTSPKLISRWLENTPITCSFRNGMISLVPYVPVFNASSNIVSLLCVYLSNVSEPAGVRLTAFGMLWEFFRKKIDSTDAEKTATLVSVLSDPLVSIRRMAAFALQWTENQEALKVAQALLRTAQEDVDTLTRVFALRSVGRLLSFARRSSDVNVSKEALFKWPMKDTFSPQFKTTLQQTWNHPLVEEAPNADALLEPLGHFDDTNLPEEGFTSLRESEEWHQNDLKAQAEWDRSSSYLVKTLPELTTAIATVEAFLSAPDSLVRRATACAIALVYHDDGDCPDHLQVLLPDETAVLWAMVDAAATGDQEPDILGKNIVKQIARWIEARPEAQRTLLIDALLDELADQITRIENSDQEETSKNETKGYVGGWPLKKVLTAILADLSERLTYKAFDHSRHNLAEVVHLLVRAAYDSHYPARKFAICALGNLQQFTIDVAGAFFKACQDVDEVYDETRTAVTKFKFFGDGSLEKLMAAIRSPSVVVSHHATVLLGELGISRSEELGRDRRKLIADQFVSILEDPLSERLVLDPRGYEPAIPLYDVIYEALVRVVAGPDATLTIPNTDEDALPGGR